MTQIQGVKSLEEVGDVYKESLVPHPKLPEITGLTTDEAVLQRLQEGTSEIRRWTKSTLDQLETLAQAPREIQEFNEEKVAEARQTLAEYLDADVKTFRRACWLGTFEQRLATTANSKAEAQDVIAGLVQDGFLEKADGGPLKIFNETYAVPARSTFKEPELEEVTGFLRQFIARAQQAEHEARTKRAQELYDQSVLSLEEFLAGKVGRITFGVPPEPVLEDGTPVLNTDETPRWRGGGTLSVDSDGAGKVYPVAASGNIQRGVEEAIVLKVHVLHHTLGWDFLGKIQGLEYERARKVVLLWNLLKRGIAAEKRNLEIRAQKAELTEGVKTISTKEFFLDGQPGVCLVILSKPWEPQVANGEEPVYIHNFFFLAERFVQESEDGPKAFIRVMKAPAHVTDYLANCMSDYPEGEKFGGCPQPLRLILQAAFGQVTKEEFLAEKYGRK